MLYGESSLKSSNYNLTKAWDCRMACTGQGGSYEITPNIEKKEIRNFSGTSLVPNFLRIKNNLIVFSAPQRFLFTTYLEAPNNGTSISYSPT